MTTPCRISPPGSLQLLTRCTSQRKQFLKPNAEINQAILYILACLQYKFGLSYHALSVLSTHLHLLLTDHYGDQIQRFNTEFFSLTARFVNQHYGRFENMWSSGKPNCVLIAPLAVDIASKAAYVCNNVIDAGLVSKAKNWPGISTLPSQMDGTTLLIRRPDAFFVAPVESTELPVDDTLPAIVEGSRSDVNPKFDKGWPDRVAITFTLPEVVDASSEELFEKIKQECKHLAQETRLQFKKKRRNFMGAKKVIQQSIHATPKSKREYFKLLPTVACKNKDLRIKFLNWLSAWRFEYKKIRDTLIIKKIGLLFPEGSYAVHFLFGQSRRPWPG